MAVPVRKRILGKKLGLVIDGKDYWADIAKWELKASSSDKDIVTFADAQGGNTSKWSLSGEAIQSLDADSFWSKVWGSVGKTVDYVLAPYGNKTASAEAPHFTGKVTIGSAPSISGEAGDEKGSTFSFEWDCEGKPAMKTAGSTLGAGNMEEALA